MATIIDNTGVESLVTEGGIVWTKTTRPSFRNYRSLDGQFFVGESFGKYWFLYVSNADGSFDKSSRDRQAFNKPEEAMAFAGELVAA